MQELNDAINQLEKRSCRHEDATLTSSDALPEDSKTHQLRLFKK